MTPEKSDSLNRHFNRGKKIIFFSSKAEKASILVCIGSYFSVPGKFSTEHETHASGSQRALDIKLKRGEKLLGRKLMCRRINFR